MQPDSTSAPASTPGAAESPSGNGQAAPSSTQKPSPALGASYPGPHPPATHHQTFWLWVMCLTGVDYFSTLGYQPSIAFEAAGILAPLATFVLVAVTLFGALPVYAHVAGSSPHGQGSIAMLERLVRGWTGKVMVLVLLGFAATDFVITKTLSAADAAEHLIKNPLWEHMPEKVLAFSEDRQRLLLTMGLLVFLGASFMRGFREVIGMAVLIVGGYLTLNAIVIGSGLYQLASHPELIQQWQADISSGNWHIEHPILAPGGLGILIASALLYFPKLALGLSGFETGVAVMPLVKGDEGDTHDHPHGRIRNTRRLLVTAALIMSIALIGSSWIVSTLIDPAELHTGAELTGIGAGQAANRALAYLAHGGGKEGIGPINPLFGEGFGTVYDIMTVVILWFAGASAMAGLLNLVPQYLPRYGMAPEWARAVRPLVALFTVINLFVTWVFDADVVAQGGAYATGVLVLMSSAGVATVIDLYRKSERAGWRRVPWGFVAITAVFLYTTAANMLERPDGIKIASCFIGAIVVSSFVSRVSRSTELRFHGFEFKDVESKFLWDSLKHLEFPVLVPHRPGRRELDDKEERIRERHRLPAEVPIVFIEAQVGDPSDFLQIPVMEIHQTEGRFVIGITRCASIAHVIAATALELSKVGKPPEIHFGWSDESPLAASAGFFLFGVGNVPWMVRELLCKAQPDGSRRPRVIVG